MGYAEGELDDLLDGAVLSLLPAVALATHSRFSRWTILLVAFFLLMGWLGKRVGKAMEKIPLVCFRAVGLLNILGAAAILLRNA